jgi:hypothetical protein
LFRGLAKTAIQEAFLLSGHDGVSSPNIQRRIFQG